MTALAVSLNLRRKQSTGKISLWERVRGTFVTARIVSQGWVVMAMNVAQHTDNKEKVQLSFSAYRTSRKHLHLFRRHLIVRGPGGETLPPPRGILGTYIVLKHSPRVFQIRLFALLNWRRLAVRPHSLCEANKPQAPHVVVFESYT